MHVAKVFAVLSAAAAQHARFGDGVDDHMAYRQLAHAVLQNILQTFDNILSGDILEDFIQNPISIGQIISTAGPLVRMIITIITGIDPVMNTADTDPTTGDPDPGPDDPTVTPTDAPMLSPIGPIFPIFDGLLPGFIPNLVGILPVVTTDLTPFDDNGASGDDVAGNLISVTFQADPAAVVQQTVPRLRLRNPRSMVNFYQPTAGGEYQPSLGLEGIGRPFLSLSRMPRK